jgi:hypothetical protein
MTTMNAGEKMVMIVAQTITPKITSDMTTEDMLLAAMKEAASHWMVTDENQRLMGAIAHVTLLLLKMPDREEDLENLRREVKMLQALSGIMSGMPIDISRVEAPEKAFGLGKLWNDAKARTP